MTDENQPTIEDLGKGKYLELVKEGRWEYARRLNVTGIVSVVALTRKKEIVLTEQFRPAVKTKVIELPSGLVGDEVDFAEESLGEAAVRELYEETGFEAKKIRLLTWGPPSAGCSNEVVNFYLARDVKQVAKGGGVDGENITVHVVPLEVVAKFLRQQLKAGKLVDPKVYTGIYFALHPR
ncbi:DNA mismatch repair protein MutT [Planctomycetales bacterium 10988]|nr:DNA mismatch repair protein MutT [Planctomycetales bacterium 10988]